MFTVKKYFPVKIVFLSGSCGLLMLPQPLRSVRGRLLAEPGNSGEAWDDDSWCDVLPPGVQWEKVMITFLRLQITYCHLPEAVTKSITVPPVN